MKNPIDWTFDDEEENNILTNPIFVNFLMNNNAYASFIKNLKNKNCELNNKKHKTIESLCDDIIEYNYLYLPFVWRSTPEGFDYWNKLNLDWRYSIKKI